MPEPRVERIGDATLYLGDCRDVLPTLGNVDAVVSDPPFGIGFKYESHGDNVEDYADIMRAVVSEVERLRGDGPAAFWQGMPNADRWHEWFPKGCGTTGVAALATSRNAILIEREEQYCEDIRERLEFYEGGGLHSTQAKTRNRKFDLGPLFAEPAE